MEHVHKITRKKTKRTFFTRFIDSNLHNKEAADEGLSLSFANHHLNTGYEYTYWTGHKLDTLNILEIARAKNGKSLFNEEFNISPLLKLATDYNLN